LDLLVRTGRLGDGVLKGRRVILENQGKLGWLEKKEPRVSQVFKGLKDLEVYLGPTENPDRSAHLVFWDPPDH